MYKYLYIHVFTYISTSRIFIVLYKRTEIYF